MKGSVAQLSFILTLALCVEVENLTLVAPPVAVFGRDFGLVAGVWHEWPERVGLLVEVALRARGHHLPRREAKIVPGVSDIVVLGIVTLERESEKRRK